jgi:hypothetical protein
MLQIFSRAMMVFQGLAMSSGPAMMLQRLPVPVPLAVPSETRTVTTVPMASLPLRMPFGGCIAGAAEPRGCCSRRQGPAGWQLKLR